MIFKLAFFRNTILMKKLLKIGTLITLAMSFTLFLPKFSNAKTIRLKLATTTSTDNSGLLNYLLPNFEKKYNIYVDVIAVGTGKALKLGENGDVDVVLVHAPSAEKEFVTKGFGVKRFSVMFNTFVILGPKNDPAGLNKVKTVTEAFKRLCAGKFTFVSRGDSSGTHIKEKFLWKKAKCSPSFKWYIEVGQGMGKTLFITNEKQGYCLSDRGTYLSLKNKLDLKICFEGDDFLRNPYSVIAVNPKRYSRLHFKEAQLFIHWLISAEAQRLIGNFKVDKEVLFHPSAK